MPQFVCAERKAGPNCSDKRLETTNPEKKDCIKQAMLSCTSDVWDCRSGLLSAMPTFVGFRHPTSGSSDAIIEPLDDLQCYTDACLEALLECYCTGLSALTCTMCDDNSGFNPFPEDEEPDVKYEDGGVLDYTPITFSDTNAVIPIAFGTVLLGGNIIWISEPSYDSEDRPVINFAVGVCEGVLAQVLRVWIGDQLVIDKTSSGATQSPLVKEYGFAVTTLSGSEAQRVYTGMVGAYGKTPAYRGLAVVHFKNYPITGVDGRMPEVRMEVATVTVAGDAAWTDTAVPATTLVYTGSSRRVIVSNGSTISEREDTLSAAIWSEAAAVRVESVAVSADEDLSYQRADDTLVYRSNESRDASSTAALAYAVDRTAVARVPGDFFDVRVVSAQSDNSVSAYYADENSSALSLFSSVTNTAVTSFAHIDVIKTIGAAVNPTHYLIAVGQAADYTVHFDSYRLQNLSTQEFIDNGAWSNVTVSPASWGLPSSSTLVNIVHLRHHASFILFFNAAGRTVAVRIDPLSPGVAEWSTDVIGAPVGALNAVDYGDEFVFLYGTVLYAINVESGAVSTVHDISGDGAPSYSGGAQHYDTRIDVLTYTLAGGTLGKARPGRYVGDSVTLEAVATALLIRAGLDATQFDLSALSTLTTNGFAITDQASAASAISSLSEFYHLGVVEASRGIRVAPLGAGGNTAVDTDTDSSSYTKRRITEKLDQVNFVRIIYFDKNSEHAPAYQDVYRDLLFGDDGGDIGTGVTIDVKVFTDATTARLSAELELMKRVQNAKEYETVLGPKHLAIEPLDFVTFSDGSVSRVTNVTTDATLTAALSSVKDDAALYAESPALSAIDFGSFSSQISLDAKLVNLPVVVSSPPARDGHNGERVWVGQINPNTTTFGESFSPHLVYWNSPTGGAVRRQSTTQEAVVGALVSGLDIFTTAEFKTDKDNTLVIKFAKDIPAGTFVDATYDEILASYTKNLLVVGKEQIQFMNHSIDVDNRTVTFTNLVRGKFGTDWYIRRHQPGELCVYYTAESFTWADLNDLTGQSGQVSISLAASGSPEVRRTVNRYFQSVKDEWMGGQLRYQDHPQRVFFQYRPRVPFRNTFHPIDGQINGVVQGEVLKIFFLTSEYDPETFQAAFREGVVGGSSYIKGGLFRHADFEDNNISFLVEPTFEVSNAWYDLGYSDRFDPIIGFTDPEVYWWKLIADVHIAIVKGNDYKRATGYTVPAGTQYREENGAFQAIKYGRVNRVF